jgi:hypothetical protein
MSRCSGGDARRPSLLRSRESARRPFSLSRRSPPRARSRPRSRPGERLPERARAGERRGGERLVRRGERRGRLSLSLLLLLLLLRLRLRDIAAQPLARTRPGSGAGEWYRRQVVAQQQAGVPLAGR